MMSMSTMRADTVVIGGGAAGMFAAATAGNAGRDVILLEPNSFLGKKLRITGKGRCNITNNCDIRDFMKNVPCNGKFLYSALNALSPYDTIAYFEDAGLPLKTERGNRVFPQSDKAVDAARCLENMLRRAKVRILHTHAQKIIAPENTVTGVMTPEGTISCDRVILCTGGLSYPATGSTGDGYKMAAALGHTVIAPKPSLVPLESDDAYCAEMQGFSLRNVTLSAYDGSGKKIYSELGEMLFTHFGVSGPLVLSASAHMRNFESQRYKLLIDLKPGLEEAKLDARILRDFEKYHNKAFKNSLGDLAGKAMIPILVRLSGIPADTQVNAVTRQQRLRLVQLFKAFPVHITGPRPISEAIITSGGVDVREVNPRTMESRLVSGLHFAGEILDVDAYTGGFNLQIAWSTAYVAGSFV